MKYNYVKLCQIYRPEKPDDVISSEDRAADIELTTDVGLITIHIIPNNHFNKKIFSVTKARCFLHNYSQSDEKIRGLVAKERLVPRTPGLSGYDVIGTILIFFEIQVMYWSIGIHYIGL